MGKILVIDDESGFRAVLSAILQKNGHEVIEAATGLDGVKLARSDHPDLILCDINLGEMDGDHAAFVLRLHPATAAIPLIMMTGNASFDGMRRSMSLGADDYLSKPFGESELIAAIQMRLKKRHETQLDAERSAVELQDLLRPVLSRELLAPLDRILGFSRIMPVIGDKLERNEVLQMTSDFRESIFRVRRQTRNYLFFSEIHAIEERVQKSLARAESMDLETVIKNAAEECAKRWDRASDLVLTLAYGRIAMREEFLFTLIDELVDNGFKFSKPGCKVEVTVVAKPPGIELVVHDWGSGMTPEQLSQLGPFRQFALPKSERHGLGLGLFIAKRLVELHDGTLKIESALQKDTSAIVRLPCST